MIDIKTVGPERDLQIAKLMGTYEIGSTAHGSKIITEACIVAGEVIWYRENHWPITCPKWSTNRLHAQLLDKEIIDQGFYFNIAVTKLPDERYSVICKAGSVLTGKDFTGFVQIENVDLDKAIADCKSQTWITWKGGRE